MSMKKSVKTDKPAPAPRNSAKPKGKKGAAAPELATTATQEAVTAETNATPAAVAANPAAAIEASAPLDLLDCPDCNLPQDINRFVVGPKKPGSENPENLIKCGDCHEKLVALQTANGGKAPRFFNLVDSRKRDQIFDEKMADQRATNEAATKLANEAAEAQRKNLEARIAKFAGYVDPNHCCDGGPADPCNFYHGQIVRGLVMVTVSPKPAIHVGDLEPLPKPPILCPYHRNRWVEGIKSANPSIDTKKIEFGTPREVQAWVEGRNEWRAKEKVRKAEKAAADEAADLVAEQERLAARNKVIEDGRLKAISDAKLYGAQPVAVPNTRSATRNQQRRYGQPNGRQIFSELNHSRRR